MKCDELIESGEIAIEVSFIYLLGGSSFTDKG